jgi:hypothetical protein
LGGYGSGRKGKVESYRSLDVGQLKKAGCLQPGFRGGWEWRAEGEPVPSIRLRATADQLILNYKVRSDGEDWTDVEEAVRLARSPCRFGGWRAYFVCPGVKNGRPCRRRVSKLYGGRYFLCRHCYDLAYASQSEDPYSRLLRRANKRKIALGGTPGLYSLPPRPKGMHQRTYERHLAEIAAAEDQGDLAFFLMGLPPRK